MDDEVLLVRTQPKRVLQQNVAKKYVLKKVDQWGFEKTWLNKEIGYGVKTQKKFIKGDFLLEYRGVLRLKADMIDIERHYDEIGAGSFVFDFKHNEISYCLDATEDNGSLCRFVNDSKLNPNAVMKKIEIDGVPRLCLFALRDISFGEEIRYSYGVALPWHHQEKMQRLFLNLYLNCSIGSERKELSDLDKTIEKNGCLYLKSEENEKKMTNWIPKIVGKVMKNGRENGYILEHQPNTMAADNEKMRTHITMKDVSSYTSLMAAINSGGKGKALLTIQFSPILRTDQWLTDYTNNLVDQLIDIPVLHPITKPGRQKQDTWVYPDGKGRVRIFKVIDGKYVEVDEVEAGLTSLCHDFSRGLNFAEKLDGTFKDLVPLVENNSHGSSFPCIIQVYSAALMALHYETIYKKFSGCPMPLVIGRSGTAKTTHTRIAARTIGINGSMYRPTKAVLERRVAAHLPLWWEDVENRNVLEAMVFMIFNHSEVPNCDKDEDPPAPPNTMPIGTTNGKFLKNFRAEDWPRFEERIVFIPIMEKVESQLSLIEIMKNDETFDQLRIVASRCFLDCLSLVEELEKDHFYTDAHLVATDKLFSTIDFFESVRSKKNYGILLYITSKILSKAGFSQERITEINKTFLINHLKPFLEKRVVDENDTDIVREEASLKKFFIRAMENPKTSLFVTDNEKAAETCKDCISFALQPINTELKFFKPDQLSSIRQIIVENGCGLTKRRMIGGPKNTQINCMHIKVAFMKEEFTSFFAERRKASITPAENSGPIITEGDYDDVNGAGSSKDSQSGSTITKEDYDDLNDTGPTEEDESDVTGKKKRKRPAEKGQNSAKKPSREVQKLVDNLTRNEIVDGKRTR